MTKWTSVVCACLFAAGCTANVGESGEDTVSEASALDVTRWSVDTRVGGGSDDAPALVTYRGQVHMVSTGSNPPSNTGGVSLLHRVFDGTNWSAPVVIPNQRSKDRPALATLTSGKLTQTLHMVHQGETSDTLWWSWFDGASWSPNVALPFSSPIAPALAAYGGKLYLAFAECGRLPDCILRFATWDGSNWSPSATIRPTEPIIGAEVSAFGRGYTWAVHDGKLYFMYREGETNRLYFMVYDGAVWKNRVMVQGQLSKSAPALASFGGELHLVHLGESSNKVWWSTFDGSNFVTNLAVPNSYSAWSPALAAMPGALVRAQKGDTSSLLYYSVLR